MPRDLALIYVRKSVIGVSAHTKDDPEADKLSEQRQLEHCISLCQARGWRHEIYADFKKGHHSGGSDKNRPGWAQMKAQLARPEVVAVVIEQLSRSYRNVRLLLELLDNDLAPRGVRLVVATLPDMDFSTPGGRSLLITLANADEMYRLMTSETTKLMIESLARSGRHWGNVPYGLVSEGKGHKYRLKAATDGSYETVIAAWQKYISEDIGMPGLADWLNFQGYRLPSGKPFMTEAARRIVESWPVFAGLVAIGGTRARKSMHKANYEPLADPTLLAAVAAREKERASGKLNHSRRRHAPLLLQGLLRCARCNGPYYSEPARRPGATTYYYHYAPTCNGTEPEPRYMVADDWDDWILNYLDECLELPDTELEHLAESRELEKERPKPDSSRKVRAQIDKQEREWRSLGLSESRVLELRGVLEHELLPSNGHEQDTPLPTVPVLPLSERVARLRQIGTLIIRNRSAEPTAANEAVRGLLKRVLVADGSIVRVEAQEWCAPWLHMT